MQRLTVLLLLVLGLGACENNQRQDLRLLHTQHYSLEKLLRNVTALDQLVTRGMKPAEQRLQSMHDHIDSIVQTLQTLPVGDCKLDSDFSRFQRNLESLRENWNETLLTLDRQDLAKGSDISVIKEFDGRITHYLNFVRGQTNVVAALSPKKEVFRLFRLMTEILSIGGDIRLRLQKIRITNRMDSAEAMKILKDAYSIGGKLQTLNRGNPRINLMPIKNPQARAILQVLLSQYDKIEVTKFDDDLQKRINNPQRMDQFMDLLAKMEQKTLSEVNTASQLIEKQLESDEQGIVCNDTSLIAKIKEKMS